MNNNVKLFPGASVTLEPGQPNPHIIGMLEQLLAMAESGELQSFVGAGFNSQGERVSVHADTHANVCEMLGSITLLQQEYLCRHLNSVL